MNDGAKRTRITYIIEAALEYFVALLVSGAFLAAILKRVGVSDAVTGIVSSFISLACVAQLFSGVIVRPNTSIKRTIMILGLVNQAMFATLYLIPFITVPQSVKVGLFVVMIMGAYILLYLETPVKYKWLNSFVSPNERGTFTANKEIVSLIGGMLFTLAMGRVVDYFNEIGQDQTGFIICGITIFVVAALHFVSLLLCEDEAPSDAVPASLLQRLSDALTLVGKSPALRRLLVADILWKTAHYIAVPYYGTYLIGELGFNLTTVSMFSILYSITRAVVSPACGKLADKKSWATLLTVCLCVAAAAFGINAFTRPGSKWLYAVYYALFAMSMAGINSGLTNITYDYIDIGSFANAMGARNAVSGIVGFLASLVGGAIVSAIQGAGNTFLGMNVYAQQVNSAISALIIVATMLYMHFVIGKMPRVAKKQ